MPVKRISNLCPTQTLNYLQDTCTPNKISRTRYEKNFMCDTGLILVIQRVLTLNTLDLSGSLWGHKG